MENTQGTANQNPVTPNAQDDKVIGVLSYLGILWIVAYILYGSKKTEYNLFHVRQGLGLFIMWIITYIVGFIPFVGWILYLVLAIFLFICAIMGIISAAGGTQKPSPVVGKLIADSLKNFK